MKLLFDENLSSKLPRLLASLFPGSVHVRECGLLGQPDEDVWEYARANGFIIISKDSAAQFALRPSAQARLAPHRQLHPNATRPTYHDS